MHQRALEGGQGGEGGAQGVSLRLDDGHGGSGSQAVRSNYTPLPDQVHLRRAILPVWFLASRLGAVPSALHAWGGARENAALRRVPSTGMGTRNPVATQAQREDHSEVCRLHNGFVAEVNSSLDRWRRYVPFLGRLV